ncbi:MAG: ethanolamine utilization protein EutP, partial [Lachnospiraceae bacterium]|nr:ethanolamine utilization protein EutP [Lachnospiraceae bacterium]
PLIGVITKTDSPYANVPMVRQWMEDAGCERIFEVNNVTGEGVEELMAYLKEDREKMTLDEAIDRQSRGVSEWENVL